MNYQPDRYKHSSSSSEEQEKYIRIPMEESSIIENPQQEKNKKLIDFVKLMGTVYKCNDKKFIGFMNGNIVFTCQGGQIIINKRINPKSLIKGKSYFYYCHQKSKNLIMKAATPSKQFHKYNIYNVNGNTQ